MKRLVKGLLAAALACGIGTAHADPYFKDKEFRIVVGFAPGGGNDLFARVFPEYLGKYIDGNPTVIIENRPGAGGVTALNWYADVAPHDGTVAFVCSGGLVTRMVLGYEGVTAKVADLKPLIAGPLGRTNYIAASTGYKVPKDIFSLKEPLFLGSTDPLSTIGSVVGLNLLKVPFKAVKGYPGKNDAMLAFQRGEITIGDIATPIFKESMMPLVKEGSVIPLFAQGILDGDNLVRDPANPDLPTIAEFYKELYGEPPSGPAWDAYKQVIRAIGNGGKILMIHKDTPPEAEAALLKAFADVQKNPEFEKNAQAALEGYGFTFGEGLQENVQAIVDIKPETKQWMRDLYKRDYGMKFN
ncbi:hypothetical protein LGR54_23455 [Ancylobacter sp. Lp-2]|uniref:Bug family tripartite tricarboxylate transporter substrate binding protein n=1 Tax=Ancylobacter sp. Lp-2 TaxID=2881339 RepID=UPI001E35950F|nr:hypothetical protein [Ancylobacter sp. Lp-2]MCB4771572.1 hypothetical protein [Ancylobacter sp. Lp-2]